MLVNYIMVVQMNQVSFNFGAYLFNAFQEQVERIIGGPFMSAFPIEETDNYSIIRADDVIYKRIGAAYLPVMASYIDQRHLIIVVNGTWDRSIPKHITDILVYHEMAHWVPEAMAMTPGLKQEIFCDRWAANKVGHEEYKEALLYLHMNYPGMIQLKRIEDVLSNSDKTSLSFKLAKLFFRS